MYNQTIVTIKANPPYHSKYLSTLPANFSMKSKSTIRLKDAIATTTTLKPIPSNEFENNPGIEIWKNDKMS